MNIINDTTLLTAWTPDYQCIMEMNKLQDFYSVDTFVMKLTIAILTLTCLWLIYSYSKIKVDKLRNEMSNDEESENAKDNDSVE